MSVLCMLLLAVPLVGCSSNHKNEETTQEPKNTVMTTESTAATEKENSDQAEESPVFIIYFSNTGTTERIAQMIRKETGGQLYQIQPEIPYTADDLKYYSGGRADQEQQDDTARPAIANLPGSLDNYDTIFLGYPIWHGQAPKIIYTLLEHYDFSGKTVIPFCTSHSSSIGNSADNLHASAESASWGEGKRFSADSTQEDITAWVDSFGFSQQNTATNFHLSKGVNGMAPTVTLNSGYEMPVLGIGTYSLKGDTCKESIKTALSEGVRLIDTAYMYGNEKEVGEAIRESGVPREEIFVITKIYPGEQFADPHKAIEDALAKLDIGYIDMMLLHHPGENDVSAYLEMEKYVEAGKIRSLGLSNWYIEEIDDFISQVHIKPALVQNEIHPYYQEQSVVPYMQDLGIVVQAWYPLGGRGHQKELLSDPVLAEIAANHGVSVAQIILRWDLQRSVVAVPGSSNPDHIKENISVFDFVLTDEEMQQITALERNEKHDWY